VAALPSGGAAAAAAVGGLLAAAVLAGRAGPKKNRSNAPPGQSADGDLPFPSLLINSAGPPVIASCRPDPRGRCRPFTFIAPRGDGGLGGRNSFSTVAPTLFVPVNKFPPAFLIVDSNSRKNWIFFDVVYSVLGHDRITLCACLRIVFFLRFVPQDS
jgi:hypothetical protein